MTQWERDLLTLLNVCCPCCKCGAVSWPTDRMPGAQRRLITAGLLRVCMDCPTDDKHRYLIPENHHAD